MTYRFEATSVAGFIQQLAVAYLTHGYWFHVTGRIPEGKDPRRTDAKLLERYGIDQSRWQRTRRKRQGLANVHYLRYRRFFVLLANHGRHPFFELEAGLIRDVRRTPIRFQGYAVSYHAGHPQVRIDGEDYLWWKDWLTRAATRCPADRLVEEFRALPFEPYAPVRRQLLCLWRAVNRQRKAAGLDQVPVTAIRLRRRIVRPFEE
jgi:hypothetical protein